MRSRASKELVQSPFLIGLLRALWPRYTYWVHRRYSSSSACVLPLTKVHGGVWRALSLGLRHSGYLSGHVYHHLSAGSLWALPSAQRLNSLSDFSDLLLRLVHKLLVLFVLLAGFQLLCKTLEVRCQLRQLRVGARTGVDATGTRICGIDAGLENVTVVKSALGGLRYGLFQLHT